MFLEGQISRSCDTKDWSNAAEIQLCITGINSILEYIKMQNIYCKLRKYFTILLYLQYFYQINVEP